MTPDQYMEAARVPFEIGPQPEDFETFGLWTLERREPDPIITKAKLVDVGWPYYTILRRLTDAKMHCEPDGQEIVMEDSRQELKRHLPIWLAARGRVLVTGLGLGCVVRGLLANPQVDHIDVVEIDDHILGRFGPEFAENGRVTLHRGDALTIEFGAWQWWDYAWHDLWCEGDGLQKMHIKLLARFHHRCGAQGAWGLPRCAKRVCSIPLLG